MSNDLLIGIDAGTSVIKAVAFDTAGRQVAVSSRRNRYRTLRNGGVEQDMRRTWADTAAVLRGLGETVDGLASRVRCLAVTGQGDGTWLIDEAGEPVHDGWLWLDARAADMAREIAASPQIDTIYRETATGVNISQMRTHLRWMQRHEPELLAQAATALHCKDWLYFRLTGVRATDPSEGVFTFGNIRERGYSDKAIAALDLGSLRALLPPIVDGAMHADPLSAAAAAETGLTEGLPVILAYVDVVCSAIGAGLHDTAVPRGLSTIGSTGVHMRFVPDVADAVLNADRCGYTMLLPGAACAQMQTNMAATLNIDWVLDLATELLASEGVTRDRGDLLARLDRKVLEAPPRAALFHPYISAAGERGPFSEPDARASFTGLDRDVGWFEMMRAVLDGLALAARDCYATLGPLPRELILTGGAARSGAVRSIVATALNTPVRGVSQPEAGAAGAAMIAGVQQGIFEDISAATSAWVAPLLEAPVAPETAGVKRYDALFDAYRATRQALPQAWAAQARMRSVLRELA